jgi:hypothetical protein
MFNGFVDVAAMVLLMWQLRQFSSNNQLLPPALLKAGLHYRLATTAPNQASLFLFQHGLLPCYSGWRGLTRECLIKGVNLTPNSQCVKFSTQFCSNKHSTT